MLGARAARATARAAAQSIRAQQGKGRCLSGVTAHAQPFTIVGGGRIGTALLDMGEGGDVLVKRGQPVDGPPGPIVVCTRNDVLADVVGATPPNRREDLVFIQNGMLQPWLDSVALSDNTQALVYFAVAKLGDSPTDGVTDKNPEGLTAACGKHAEAFAARLHKAGLKCHVLGREAYTQAMLEKLVWICAFMLVGARHGGCTVGEVESEHSGEVSELVTELAEAGAEKLGIEAKGGYLERLCAYSRSVAHFPTAVKELQWRNGWFSALSDEAKAAGRQDPCPRHTAWLAEVTQS